MREVGQAIGSIKARRGRFAQARAALCAAEPYIAARESDALEGERMSLAVTVATRVRSAQYDFQHQAIAVCVKIARKHYRAGRPAASNAALECVEAMRALLPEMEG